LEVYIVERERQRKPEKTSCLFTWLALTTGRRGAPSGGKKGEEDYLPSSKGKKGEKESWEKERIIKS